MDLDVKIEPDATSRDDVQNENLDVSNSKSRVGQDDRTTNTKRRCVSTACIACRRRKSKCDGNLPKCAACASVYLTECEYAPHTDHRRKGVYKKEADTAKSKNATLQILTQALLNYNEDEAVALLRQMRMADSLEELAQTVDARGKGLDQDPDSPIYAADPIDMPRFDAELSGKMGDLFLDGSVKFIGGTSNLVWFDDHTSTTTPIPLPAKTIVRPREEAILSWTNVTKDKDLILHFLNMYFCWHYPYFTTLSKELFYRDFLTGTPSQYCSSILVNAMLAVGCHFSSKPAARADPDDSSTTGDHYFAEAKELLYENEEFANARLCTVQALAIMSVREAGCGRENKGWVYSGMSFRMASDLGLNVDAPPMNDVSKLSDEDIDARRITFWGCFLFDKCWSNYLGRQPQLELALTNTKKFEVFPSEDSEMWSPYTDAGIVNANAQPARTRAVALQISKLAEISADVLTSFYHPALLEAPMTKQAELKKLTDIHTRLEAWKAELPAELEAKDGQLPTVLLMHMFFQLLYMHLYRPFLRYTKSTSPLPPHVSPRKFCTQAANAISKLLRLYKRTHGLRQIINKVIYIAHSACTIHLLNLPDKNARRDIIHGIKQLEEMGDCWIAARRTLKVLQLCAERWKIELPDEAEASFVRSRLRWGSVNAGSGPVSPDTFKGISQQIISSTSVPDMMAQNMLSRPPALVPNFSDLQRGHLDLSPPLMSPPQLPTAPARLSDSFSQSPQFVTEPSRATKPSRPYTHLTKEQQDAWNALQMRMMNSSRSNSTQPVAATSTNAASLFGGVESLIEESQDWWYKDQNQLAQGFDNWNGPSPDWSGINGTQQHSGTTDINHVPAVGPNGLFAPVKINNEISAVRNPSMNYGSRYNQVTNANARVGTQHSQHSLYQNQGQQKRQITWDEDLF